LTTAVTTDARTKALQGITMESAWWLTAQAPMSLHTIRSLFARRTRLITELHGHTGPIISLAISPGGRMLASGGKLKPCPGTNSQADHNIVL